MHVDCVWRFVVRAIGAVFVFWILWRLDLIWSFYGLHAAAFDLVAVVRPLLVSMCCVTA